MGEIRLVMLAGALWAVPSWLAIKVTGRHVLGPTQPIAAFFGGVWMGAQIWMAREGQSLFVRGGFAGRGLVPRRVGLRRLLLGSNAGARADWQAAPPAVTSCTAKLTMATVRGLLPQMRTLWMVVVVLLVGGVSGCRRRVPNAAQVFVPNTPEAQACRRECMVVRNSCQGGRGVNERVCRQREIDCLWTCPGACDPKAFCPAE